jgi:hypothetical protein
MQPFKFNSYGHGHGTKRNKIATESAEIIIRHPNG